MQEAALEQEILLLEQYLMEEGSEDLSVLVQEALGRQILVAAVEAL
jgi:hypothetical protein